MPWVILGRESCCALSLPGTGALQPAAPRHQQPAEPWWGTAATQPCCPRAQGILGPEQCAVCVLCAVCPGESQQRGVILHTAIRPVPKARGRAQGAGDAHGARRAPGQN